MRMPIFAYFLVVGTALLALLVVSDYALTDVGSPVKTSQLVGLQKVEPKADRGPVTTVSTNFAAASTNFAAPEKANPEAHPLNGIHAEQINEHKQKSPRQAKSRQADGDNARSGHSVAVYSHDVVMGIH